MRRRLRKKELGKIRVEKEKGRESVRKQRKGGEERRKFSLSVDIPKFNTSVLSDHRC